MIFASVYHWRVAWSFAVVMAIFYLAVLLVPFRLMMQVLNALVLCVSLSVVITYAPAWLRTLRKDRLNGPDALSLGIGGTWCAEIGQRIWSIAWRGLDQPQVMLTSHVLLLFLMLSFMGGVLHLTAPGAVDGYVPRRNWIVLGITMGVAAFVVVVVFALGWHGLAEGP